MMHVRFHRFIHGITQEKGLVVEIDFEVHGAKIGMLGRRWPTVNGHRLPNIPIFAP